MKAVRKSTRNVSKIKNTVSDKLAASVIPEYFSEDDIARFQAGTHDHICEKLGSHILTKDGIEGVYFAVWAPSAEKIAVIGSFNDWNKEASPSVPSCCLSSVSRSSVNQAYRFGNKLMPSSVKT